MDKKTDYDTPFNPDKKIENIFLLNIDTLVCIFPCGAMLIDLQNLNEYKQKDEKYDISYDMSPFRLIKFGNLCFLRTDDGVIIYDNMLNKLNQFEFNTILSSNDEKKFLSLQ